MQLYNGISRSNSDIEALAERIKPVVDGRWIEPPRIFNTAYTWSPKPLKKAKGLKPLAKITTYHKYGFHGFFKPSIGEVICCIPEEHLEQCVAFEIIRWPSTADDLNAEHEALNAGYHVATVQLYKAKKKKKD